MSEYDTILSAASQLPVADRLRLIDELAASVPDDQPPVLSEAWLKEIERRSEEIDSGVVETEPWPDVRRRLFGGMRQAVRIDFHPDATRELEASADWYAERSPAAARGFVIAIDAVLQKIGDDPERFPLIDRRHRSCNLERYPFQIVFRIENGNIYILAVAHAKRRPGYWRAR